MYNNYDEQEYEYTTSTDYDLILQSAKEIYCKIDLMDLSYNLLGHISGNVIECSYSQDSTSDIRNTMSLQFVVDDYIGLGADKAIWYDKTIRVKIGYLHLKTNTIRWYSIGTYVYDTVNSNFDPATKTMSVSCVDLCALLNGDHGGVLPAKEVTIEQGSSIYDVIDDITKKCPFVSRKKIIINKQAMVDKDDNIYYDYPIIPYDLEFSVGTTWFEILKTIRDLYAGYEFFFEDTVFVFQPVHTDEYSPVVLNHDYTKQIKIAESTTYDFKEVKNVTEVWGMCYEVDHFSIDEKTSYDASTGIYTLTMDSLEKLTDGTLFGFTAPASNTFSSCYIKVMTSNGVCLTPDKSDDTNKTPGAYIVRFEDGKDLPSGKLDKDSSYIMKYKSGYFYYMGQHQIAAVVKLVSSYPTAEELQKDKLEYPVKNIRYVIDRDSPFCVDKIGTRLQVLSSGDYDNIYTEQLAIERAEYDNWLKTDLIDSVSLECIDVPFLRVNEKIEYLPEESVVPVIYDVISKQGNPMEGTMSIQIKKHKGLYPWLEQKG